MMSITRVLRTPGQSSLNVSLSTLTVVPLMGLPLRYQLYRLFGDEFPYSFVYAAPRKDDLRLVAQHFRLVREVIGIDADAVAADGAGLEIEEVPLSAGRFQHLGGVDAEPIEHDREIVHERDTGVALGILDHLGGLGHFDAGGAVHASLNYRAVEHSNAPPGFRHPRQIRLLRCG